MDSEEVPIGDEEIPMNDVEIPMNDIEVPMSEIEISVNDMEVPINYIEVSTNDMKASMNDIEVPMNEIEISVEDVTCPMDHIEVTMHNLEVPELGASEIILDRIVQTKPAKSRYRYNTKWESNPLFAKWVQPVENDITKAYCTLCHAKLLARYNFLCKHRETFKHRKRDPNDKDRMMGKIGALPLFYSMPSKDTDTNSQLKIIRVQTELDKCDNTKNLTVKRRLQRYVQVPTARKKLHIEPGWEGKMTIVTVPSPCCKNIKYIRSLTKENPKNLIPQLCKRLFKLGWLDGTGGGVSIKYNDLIYITPAGVQRDRIQPDELFCQTINNIDVETPDPLKGLKKSQCTPLFILFYKKRKAGAVIHTHSSYSALATALWPQKEFCISHQEMIKGIKDPKLGRNLRYDEKLVVPIIENLQFEKDLEPTMAKVLNRYPGTSAILVRKHGLYVWGDTWKSTKTMTECYENLFKIAVELKKIEPDAELCLRN